MGRRAPQRHHPPLLDDEVLERHLRVHDAIHLSSSPRHGTWRMSRAGEELVLKVFPETQELRYLRELAVLHNVRHRHLMALDRCGSVGGPDGRLFWYTAPFVPGGDVGDAIEARSWPDERGLAGFATGMASVLSELHGQSIAHCDVKPANIARRRGSWADPVLLDPGIVRFVASDPPDGSPVGTTPYMAPEQLRRAPAEPASDVFALGVVLYRLVSRGRHPFVDRGERISRSQAEQRMGRGPSVPIPGPWGDLVARLLAVEPGRRPPAAALVAELPVPDEH